jgi:hypothetical protein
VLLGPQKGHGGLVGPAGGAQPALGVGQHQAGPVDPEQAHARVHQQLHRPVEVAGRVQVLQGLQVLAAGAVLGLGHLGRERRPGRLLRGQRAQQPAKGPQLAVALEHRLDGDGHGDDLAAAPPEPQRHSLTRSSSPRWSRPTIERNPQRSLPATQAASGLPARNRCSIPSSAAAARLTSWILASGSVTR